MKKTNKQKAEFSNLKLKIRGRKEFPSKYP